MLKKLLLTGFIAITSLYSFAQYNANDVNNYINRYKDIAIEEQIRCGIPASITLAQGIFETAAGTSELCTNAQNHFGIKCKNTWTGDTYNYTDDAKDECFRRYKDALTSYKDHSDFLKQNKRYAALFFIPVTDYEAWAKGLKRCGYATNKVYAEKLVETIKKYNLEQYTDIALASAGKRHNNLYASANNAPGEYIPTEKANKAEAASYSKPTGINYYETTNLNGLKGFYARKGDLLLEYAINNKIRYGKLLEWNDLADEPLPADMFIYTEKKNKTGYDATYTVNDGETLLEISQQEGIQLQQLRAYNHLSASETPMPGTVLYLQNIAPDKPDLAIDNNSRIAAKADNRRYTATESSDYIATRKVAVQQSNNTESNTVDASEEDIQEDAGTAQEHTNIADEEAIEEEHVYARQQSKRSEDNSGKNMSKLDKLKAQLDKSVYTDGDNKESNTDPYHKDEAPQVIKTDIDNEQLSNKAKTNPAAALKQHMEKVQDEDKTYTPKTNEDRLIRSKNLHQQTTVKQATAKKPVHPAAKTTKKAAYHKKAVAGKKAITHKKVTPQKKAAAKKPAPKKKK